MYDEAKVRENERSGSLDIPVSAKALGQRLLVFTGQHRHAGDAVEIRIEAAEWPGEGELGGAQGKNLAGHAWGTSAVKSSTLCI